MTLARHLAQAALDSGCLATLATEVDRLLPLAVDWPLGQSAPRKGDPMRRDEDVVGVSRPHKHGRRWRLQLRYADGQREWLSFDGEEEAHRRRRALALRLGSPSVGEAVGQYRRHLEAAGNKPRSILTTAGRLLAWLDAGRLVAELTPGQLEAVYRERRARVAVDTSRNELAEVRTFLGWCVARGWLQRSPAADLVPQGRRRAGKPRLHIDEAQVFVAAARELYGSGRRGWEGGLGALLALYCGLRSSEVSGLQVRDVDASGGVLWVAEGDGKTDAARRIVEVELPWLAELLGRQAAAARARESEWLFPARTRAGHRGATWLRKAVRGLCGAAGVQVVSPHGLRGTGATLARRGGGTAAAVADALGHTTPAITRRHYLEPGTDEEQQRRTVFRVIDGGAG